MHVTDKLKDYLLAKAIDASKIDCADPRIQSLTLDSISVLDLASYSSTRAQFIVLVDTLWIMTLTLDISEFESKDSFWCL